MTKCQTCSHPTNAIAPGTHWCVRCGSLHFVPSLLGGEQVCPPDIVNRVRQFSSTLKAEQWDVKELLCTLGVTECLGEEV